MTGTRRTHTRCRPRDHVQRRPRGHQLPQESLWRARLLAATSHLDLAHAVLLGVDPSINTCGLAQFRGGELETTTTLTSRGRGVDERLDDLFAQFRQRLGQTRPDLVVLEEPDAWTRARARGSKAVNAGDLMKLACAYGVVRAACAAANSACLAVSVCRWKGTSSKQATAARVRLLTGTAPDNDHAADAAALVLWLLEQHRFVTMITR